MKVILLTSNGFDEAVFDSILKRAFSDAFEREFNNLFLNHSTKKHKKATHRGFKFKVHKQTGI